MKSTSKMTKSLLVAVVLSVLTVVSAAWALENLGQVYVGHNPYSIVFNPNDGLAYVNVLGPGGEGVVKVKVDGNVISTVGKLAGGTPRGLTLNPVTNTLFIADFWSYRVWPVDLATGTFLPAVPTPGCRPLNLASFPSAGLLYVAGTGSQTGGGKPGCVRALDDITGEVLGSLSVPYIGDVAVDIATGTVYLSEWRDPKLLVIRGGPGGMFVAAEVGIGQQQPLGVAVNPVTHRVYVGGRSDKVWVIDGVHDTVVTSVPCGNFPFKIAVRPSVNRVYVTLLDGATVLVINGETNTIIDSGWTGNSPRGVAFDDVTGLIYVANDQSGTVSVLRDVPGPAPVTPQEQIRGLVGQVIGLNLQQGIENGLEAKLDAAVQALDDVNKNNDVAAINALQAFINAVEAQRGKEISDADADALIAAAQEIIDLLSGS